ncbi:ribonucleoside-diphosphate reductase [Dishui Lake phycodnavirus 4]|nr:ribonucleoside-diphosphate reductase [Dishui Lake phycodnavirus 4]
MKVIKRSGQFEEMKFDKVTARISNLIRFPYPISESISPDKIAQQVVVSMYDGISTQELDILAAEITIAMITVDPDYEILATRIIASNIQKMAPKTFEDAMKELYENNIVTQEVYEVSKKVSDKIVSERDNNFNYFGLKTLEKAYLSKIKDKLIETPQYLYMRVSIGIHGEDIQSVLETYEMMSLGNFIHATPTLFNSGTPKPQMSSCFLISSKGDSVDGIYDTIKECAQISKWAGGIGVHIHDVRSKNSHIKGTNGQSSGIIPMLRVYNATARHVDQAGRRKGSIAVYLEPWHADVMDFLELRFNQGDEEARCRDLFTALWIPDLFMKRVEENKNWSLFCPNVAKGLSDVYGEEFEKLYEKYEDEGLAVQTIPAYEIWKSIIKSQTETGTPYMLYKDTCNRRSNQKNIGIIKSSNLCVAPETKILTKEGYQTISNLKDQEVEVWNGEEFSKVIVKQTGENQKLITVSTSRGMSLRCTPYHKFWILSGSDTKPAYECHKEIQVEAKDLKPGMCIIKHDLPIIDGSSKIMNYAYTHGLFCADGTVSKNTNEKVRCRFKACEHGFCSRHQNRKKEYDEDDGYCQANSYSDVKVLDLYGVKRNLVSHIDYIGNPSVNQEMNKVRLTLPCDIMDKYYTPTDCSLETKLEWLAGYLDGDGCILKHSRGGKGCSIQVVSVNHEFLTRVSLLLQTLGIHSTINVLREERTVEMPGGVYTCKKSWRLLIASGGISLLSSLGFKPKRLIITPETGNRSAIHYQRIVSIEDHGDVDDTYCFTEPLKHRGIFNGILTGQCAEIQEVSTKDETSVCNLASVSLPKFLNSDTKKYDFNELHRVIKIMTKNLNRVIDRNFYPVEAARKSNMRHRPIGLGVQGLADVFNLSGFSFESEEAKLLNAHIFETIYHGALEASCELSDIHGPYETFEGSPTSQGILQFDMAVGTPLFSGRYDWNAMRERVKNGIRNSLLVAPMPTASTAQILGNNECFEPYTTNIYVRRTLAGEFVVVNKQLVNDLKKLGLWSKEMKDLMVRTGGSIQTITDIPDSIKELYKTVWEISQKTIIDMARERGYFVDQSQSMNLFLENPTLAKVSSMHMYAWKSGLKTGMYYLRSKAKSRAIQFSLEPTCSSCSA